MVIHPITYLSNIPQLAVHSLTVVWYAVTSLFSTCFDISSRRIYSMILPGTEMRLTGC